MHDDFTMDYGSDQLKGDCRTGGGARRRVEAMREWEDFSFPRFLSWWEGIWSFTIECVPIDTRVIFGCAFLASTSYIASRQIKRLHSWKHDAIRTADRSHQPIQILLPWWIDRSGSLWEAQWWSKYSCSVSHRIVASVAYCIVGRTVL